MMNLGIGGPILNYEPLVWYEGRWWPVMQTYKQLANDLGELVHEKNKAYGDSVASSAVILENLYPNGIQPEQYSDMMLVVRVIDKLKRIATRKDAFGESPWQDISGYGLLGFHKDQREQVAKGKTS